MQEKLVVEDKDATSRRLNTANSQVPLCWLNFSGVLGEDFFAWLVVLAIFFVVS